MPDNLLDRIATALPELAARVADIRRWRGSRSGYDQTLERGLAAETLRVGGDQPLPLTAWELEHITRLARR